MIFSIALNSVVVAIVLIGLLGDQFCVCKTIAMLTPLTTLPRDNALAVLLAFGSAKTWLPDFHRHSYVPCPAHTFEITGAARLYRAASGGLMGWAATGSYPPSLQRRLSRVRGLLPLH